MVYMHVSLYFFLVPEEGRRGEIRSPWDYRSLWAVIWVQGIEPRFSETSTSSHSAMSWIPSPEFLVFLSPSSKSYDVICVYYHNFIGSVCGFVLCVCFMLIIFVSLPILRNMKSVTLVFNQSHRNFFPLNWSLNISWVLVGGGHTPFLNLFVIWFTITWLWLYFKVFCSFLHHINTLP